MIYVLSKFGKPLMPTERAGWVRRALRSGMAKVVRRTPFTIQLLYDSTEYIQEITLGVDAGSKFIGLSATTEQKEVFAAEVQLRTDIVDLLSTRKSLRRTRRNRKTRYRKVRFFNRKKPKGWLAPSVRWKIEAHKRIIRFVHKILPISKIIVETAQFDIQKIKNPDIQGEQYQLGDQLGFANVREYVLYRDGHKCQLCGKSKIKLHVHHIESRKTGGDSPGNLVTLCLDCHDKVHAGTKQLKKRRGASFRDATGMVIMRPTLLKELREEYSVVEEIFGYATKEIRRRHSFEKSHINDARCIGGNLPARLSRPFAVRFVRRHNRQIHKMKTLKGGVRKLNQSPRYVFGFQLFDKVEFKGQECFIFGRRQSGKFDVRLLNGNSVSTCANYKKLRLLESSTGKIFQLFPVF